MKMGRTKSLIIYLTFLYFVFNSFAPIYSFGTGRCNHKETSSNVLNLISCMNDLIERHLENFIKEYKEQLKDNGNTFDIAKVQYSWISIYDELRTCVTDFTSTCFEDEITNLANLFFDSLKPILQDIDRNHDIDKYMDDFVNELHSVTRGDPEGYVERIFSSDKSCSIERIGETTEREILEPCLGNKIDDLGPIFEYVDRAGNTFPSYVSVCQTMDNTMTSCFVETSCISTQEMTFLKNVTFQIYKNVMEKAEKIKEQFGTVTNMIDTLKSTTFEYDKESITGREILESDPVFRDQKQERLIQSVDSLFDDYNGYDCQAKVAALAKELVEPATSLECTLGGQGVALEKGACTDGATLCAILKPLEGTKKDQIAYSCMKTSTLSTFGYTETVKETQTCQKITVNSVNAILCACSKDNCNADDTLIKTIDSVTSLKCFVGTPTSYQSTDCDSISSNVCAKITLSSTKTTVFSCSSSEIVTQIGFYDTITNELKCIIDPSNFPSGEYCFCNNDECNNEESSTGTSSSGTCDDGIQNQNEKGVDCGGPCPYCQDARCYDGVLENGLDHRSCPYEVNLCGRITLQGRTSYSCIPTSSVKSIGFTATITDELNCQDLIIAGQNSRVCICKGDQKEYCNVPPCKGGDSCCGPDNRCGEDEGDCDENQDCMDGLVCGNNNCRYNSGYEWDSYDDCCEKQGILKCFAGSQEAATSEECPVGLDVCGTIDNGETIRATCLSQDIIASYVGFSGRISDELQCVTKKIENRNVEYCFCNTNNCNYLGCQVDESFMKKATDACGCEGVDDNGKPGLDFDVSGCQLSNEYEYDGVFCKKSADSYCRNKVEELANAYRKANTGKNKHCSEKDPTYRGIQEAAAYCKVGCIDNDIVLRGTLRSAKKSILDLVESKLENMTCKSFKESEIWRQGALQPNKGRADTWISFCKYIYFEVFSNNIDTFPCRETCGFCDDLRCFEKKEGTQFEKSVPIESAEESFESRSCEIFQDSCVTITHWCSSDSVKMVGKGCTELTDLKKGAEYFGFEKDEIKQGTCLVKSTMESNMNQKQLKDFTGCGNLTAIACICNTNDCNGITINETVPEVISQDQKLFRLYKPIDKTSRVKNEGNSAHCSLIQSTNFVIIVLIVLFERL